MTVITVVAVDAPGSTTDFLPVDLLPEGTRVVTEVADSPGTFEAFLQWFEPDLVLANYALPTLPGLEALARLQQLRPGVPLVFVATVMNDAQALEALRHGARDYVLRSDRARLMAALLQARMASTERRVRDDVLRNLQNSEIRFRLFMEHMPGAAYMKDLDGRFVFANSIALRALGRPAEQVMGHTLRQLYPADVADALDANDRRALDVRQPIEALEQISTPDGLRTFLSVKFPVPDAHGKAEMVGGFSLDVTHLVPQGGEAVPLGNKRRNPPGYDAIGPAADR
jgi:PAS domain S-box-containing protein